MGSPSARKTSTAGSSVASAGTKGNPTKLTTGRQTILPFIPVSKAQAIAIPLSPSSKNNNAPTSNPLLDTKALNYSSVKPSGPLKQTSLLSRLKSVKANATSSASKSTKENQPISSSQPTADVSTSTGPRRTLKRSNSAFSSLDIVGKDWLQNAPTKKSCKVVNKTHVMECFKTLQYHQHQFLTLCSALLNLCSMIALSRIAME